MYFQQNGGGEGGTSYTHLLVSCFQLIVLCLNSKYINLFAICFIFILKNSLNCVAGSFRYIYTCILKTEYEYHLINALLFPNLNTNLQNYFNKKTSETEDHGKIRNTKAEILNKIQRHET